MMEFTWHGLVRHGFGFYNPNHAAAFLNVLIVFAYGAFGFSERIRPKILRRAAKTAILLGGICLVLALVATYSRAGILVFLLCMSFLLAKGKKKSRGVILSGTVIVVFFCILFGLHRRFMMDDSVLHRLDIWLAGFRLLRANFWNGVGFGNSGLVASVWMLPSGIECRTLVNAPLTLLVENGWRFGLFWIPPVLYALFHGYSKSIPWCAFAGLLLSSSVSSVFDFGVLLDFRDFGSMGIGNFLLSWLLFLVFLTMAIILVRGCFSPRAAVLATGTTVFIFLCFGVIPPDLKTPIMIDRLAIIGCQTNTVVYHDGSKPLRQIVSRLSEDVFPRIPYSVSGYQIPLDGSLDVPTMSAKSDLTILCGACVEFSERMDGNPIIVVDPPDLPFRSVHVKQIFLPPFRSYPVVEARATEHGIPVTR